MRIQSGSLQPPEVSSFPGRHLANSRTRCLGKTHLLRDVSVLRLCALSGRWGCLRSRRHFWTHAAATTSSTTERDLSGGFSDGLNGFIPSWAMGMLKARPLPEVATYQQTVVRSFQFGGIGLHTGEYSFIRVRPAFAGEGRYFVRVPKGTNGTRYGSVATAATDEESSEYSEEWSPEQTHRFLMYLNAQDLGFDGSYLEWSMQTFGLKDHVHVDQLDDFCRREQLLGQDLPMMEYTAAEDGAQPKQPVPPASPIEDPLRPIDTRELEVIVGRADSERGVVMCNLENMDPDEQGLSMNLVQNDVRVMGVEHLLAALEAMGVDNCRIEIEGGPEVPIDDGSSLPWVLQIQAVGLRPAPLKDGTAPSVPRILLRPKHTVSVSLGTAFITLYPTGGPTEVTCGVNQEAEAPVIGRQWYSWQPGLDPEHSFRYQLAPARTFVPSLRRLYELRSKGYYKGGTVGSALIGYGDRWYENALVRYIDSEPARHKVLDLVGDLALLSTSGNAGMPLGHIVAYNADHNLHAIFMNELREACEDAQLLVPPQPWEQLNGVKVEQEAGSEEQESIEALEEQGKAAGRATEGRGDVDQQAGVFLEREGEAEGEAEGGAKAQGNGEAIDVGVKEQGVPPKQKGGRARGSKEKGTNQGAPPQGNGAPDEGS